MTEPEEDLDRDLDRWVTAQLRAQVRESLALLNLPHTDADVDRNIEEMRRNYLRSQGQT